MTTGRRPRLRTTVIVAVALLVASLAPMVPAAPASALTGTITLDGRGWGHGRGLSQFGSLGYAVDHGWDWRQILGHYYSNTSEASIATTTPMSVRLTAFDGQATPVVRGAGRLRTSVTGAAEAHAWKAEPNGSGYRIFNAASCDGPWTLVTETASTEVRFYTDAPADDSANPDDLLSVCEPNGWRRWYRGDIRAVHTGTSNVTVNHTTIERYLRGVVPRESPASWGAAGGGKGMNALRAQSVAARSYGAAEARYAYAKSCDTASCQVYSGAFHSSPGGVAVPIENPYTDQAIVDTAGVVRSKGGGVPARTEFSSSTGGWTAGGEFTAVQDLGDSTASNPNHTWSSQLKVSAVEGRYPEIGRLTGIDVTRRNGLGPDGGRVLTVVIRGSAGSVSLTGNQFRSAFSAMSNCTSTTGTQVCVKSDWFTPRFSVSVGVSVADTGHWVVRADGSVSNLDGAAHHGDMGGQFLAAPMIGMSANPAGTGYWLVARDGGIFTFGAARFHGSTGGMRLNQPVLGMGSTATGNGYWLVAADGGIFSFGDARFYGSTGAMHLNQPVVGMAPTPSGKGYWLVARDGGIFTFGDARFYGSTGAMTLNEPIIAMAPTPSGKGYWLLARDGGVFSFGDARFHGSLAGWGVHAVGMAPTRSGDGYWIVAQDGATFAFGGAL